MGSSVPYRDLLEVLPLPSVVATERCRCGASEVEAGSGSTAQGARPFSWLGSTAASPRADISTTCTYLPPPALSRSQPAVAKAAFRRWKSEDTEQHNLGLFS